MTTAAIFTATYVAAFLAGVWHAHKKLWPWAGFISLLLLTLSLAFAVTT